MFFDLLLIYFKHLTQHQHDKARDKNGNSRINLIAFKFFIVPATFFVHYTIQHFHQSTTLNDEFSEEIFQFQRGESNGALMSEGDEFH